MAISCFEGETADEAWSAAAVALSKPELPEQPSRIGPTREILHAVLRIGNPRARWIVARTPTVSPALAIAEVFAMLTGRQDADFFSFWSKAYTEYNGPGPTYRGAYGYRLKYVLGVDQVRRAIDVLTHDSKSRQVVLQIWNGGTDLPNDDGSSRMSDIPCNLVAMLKVRDGKLHWTQVLRSNDLYRGVPYNVLQFTMLQEVIATEAGVDVGEYAHWSDSLHCYTEDLAKFGHEGAVSPRPSLKLPRLGYKEYERAIQAAVGFLEAMQQRPDDTTAVRTAGLSNSLPAGYTDWVKACAAERARKLKSTSLMQEIVACIEDDALRNVVSKWNSERPGTAAE